MLARIRDRLANAHWANPPDDDADWTYGTDRRWLQGLVDHWLHRHDCRSCEAWLNRWPQYTTTVDGIRIHFYRVRGSSARPRPLLLTHGWPGSVVEFLGCIDRLAFPARFGGDARDGFDVVIPSLPGYGFSGKPPRPIGPRRIAPLGRKLMVEQLDCPRFVAQGGDWGAAVTTWLGALHADACAGIHLNMLPTWSVVDTSSDSGPDLADYLDRVARLSAREMGYFFEQSTKPQTIGLALADSPLGFAAWVCEKFRTWGDTHGDIGSRFPHDMLITNLMTYLATDSVASAIWLYRGRADERATPPRVTVPTSVALFPAEPIPYPPRRLAERSLSITWWTAMKAGGTLRHWKSPRRSAATCKPRSARRRSPDVRRDHSCCGALRVAGRAPLKRQPCPRPASTGRLNWRQAMRTPFILAAALVAAAAAHAQTVLRHSNWFPEGQVMRVKVIDPWKEEVAKVTQGRVKIETAPKVIGSVPGQFNAARDGLADIVVFSNGYTPGRFDVLEIGELPFMGDKPEVFGPALHRFYTKHAAPYGEYKGVHPLAVFVVAPPQLFNSKRALKTVADFKGLKIRSNSAGTSQALTLLGAVPVSKPATETYELMSSGVLDGTVMPPESILPFKLVEMSNFATIIPGAITNSILTLAINEAKWNSLSQADRDAISKVSGEVFARNIGLAYGPGNEATWQAMRKAGKSIETANPALVAEMKKLLAPMEVGWAEKARKKGVAQPEKLLEALRAEVAAVEAGR